MQVSGSRRSRKKQFNPGRTEKKILPTSYSRKKRKDREKKKMAEKPPFAKWDKKMNEEALGFDPWTSWSAINCSTMELDTRWRSTQEADYLLTACEHQMNTWSFSAGFIIWSCLLSFNKQRKQERISKHLRPLTKRRPKLSAAARCQSNFTVARHVLGTVRMLLATLPPPPPSRPSLCAAQKEGGEAKDP